MKITLAYFSATDTTRTIVGTMAEKMGFETREYNLTGHDLKEDVKIPSGEALLVGVPVYAGRVPGVVVESLKHFKGEHTPVILVAVYGNRAYDDALVELQDLFEADGFFVMAGGAFLAQHSMFPQGAAGRPDELDHFKILRFAVRCKYLLERGFSSTAQSVRMPGNRPYKPTVQIPFKVHATEACIGCGKCAKECPVGAISLADPRVTDYDKCIRCARCVYICPEHARTFDGEDYQAFSKKFLENNSERKEPEVFF